MKNLPVLKYNDLRGLMCLDHHYHNNGVIVDDAALEVMLRIEKSMSRLSVMGDDERREIWINLKAPGKHDREEDADVYGNYWYLLVTGCYRQMHYMILSNRSWRFIDLRSHESGRGERNPDVISGNISKELTLIERYVNALVDCICINSDEYNEFVALNLPYNKRNGKIRRKDLNRICPCYRTFDDPEHVIELVKDMKAMQITTYDKMTLRTYMHVWRMLYEAYRTKDKIATCDVDRFDGLSDIEVFKHNSKGREIEGLDIDSEEDFLKWEEENSSYHCLDVAYARIHLLPTKNEEQSCGRKHNASNDKWYFSLGYSVYGYSEDIVNMLEALRDSRIGVYCPSMRRLLKMAQEDDYVGLSPIPDKYRHSDEVGNEISLPSIDSDITEEQVCQVIKATHWEPLEKVGLDMPIPIEDEIYNCIREETVKPLTISEIRRIYEQKYITYLSVHHEPSRGYYYTERSNDGDYNYRYFSTFNEAMRDLIISDGRIRKGKTELLQ